jgi:large subunit ribosomal protein L30
MEKKTLIALRIRGGVNVPKRIEDTLRMLRIDRNYYSTILDSRPSFEGMLKEAKDYITWGEADIDTIKLLLVKRARLYGDKRITNEILKDLGFESFQELAEAVYNGNLELHKEKSIKPFFRLHPPTGGFKRSTKRGFRNHGELGYRGEAINELIKRMC